MNDLVCLDSVPNLFGVFDTTVAPDLLFYSYIPIAILSLGLAFFIIVNSRDKKPLPSTVFFILNLFFVVYILNEILQWTLVPAEWVMLSWEFIVLIKGFIAFLLVYFIYTFLFQKDLSLNGKVFLFLPFLPILLLMPSTLNMSAFNLTWCEADIGPLFYYLYIIEMFAAIVIIRICWYRYRSVDTTYEKRQSLLMMIGGVSFIFFLSAADMLGEFTGEFEYLLIGPIGMAVFLVLIGYMIVKYSAFNIKLAAAQALMVGLVILIASQLFFVQTLTNTLLVVATLVLAMMGGYILVRSVMKEIRQREELQSLTEELARANERLKELDKAKSEFVSIASHQLRSPITSIRGYASLLLEGSYGTMPEKALDPLQRIDESSKLMAIAIEDYLNISRIESGNMKYNLADFNLPTETEHVCDDLRSDAIKRGLALIFRTDLHSQGIVNADLGKTVQIVQNLITNSIKYTEQGTIKVLVRDDVVRKKIYVDIIDTGIGMNAETLASIFQKFERAKNANSVNIHGTGLGLFVALKMAEAMGGTITAHSDGDGKGSRFTFELPLAL